MIKSDATVRLVKPEDHAWVNACYQSMGFLPSRFSEELVIIAELKGERVGVGRLVSVGDKILELGGMYVEEQYRGTGVASRLITQLIAEAEGYQLFCIAFESKVPLYFVQGFVPFDGDLKDLPSKLKAKFYHCATTHPERMHLLEYRPQP